ncbi:uncharacterized protein C7orf50 homolog [Myotis daubentonii]|uniref:uncharacterized protein C7orf50 homolog n=1 Tax=Myotis daubentonii TaxID=98922 RepID=UPI002872F47A|nr:uncharacterized protein C7orf50 homolog [Myotis daubentonii]
MGGAAPEGGTALPGRWVCRKPASAATRRMAAPKRKAPGTPGAPEKKNRKLKKALAAEKPPAPAAPQGSPGSTDARPEESASSEAELTPREKRVLERKRKKERKKAERKRLREAAAAAAAPALPAKPSGAQLALDYLCGWAQKRQNWRFQKTRQTWLLLHMYDYDQVPDQHFPTLLAYLEGLRGRARELTLQEAEAVMQQLDKAGASPGRPLLEWSRRARQVLQLLS